MTLDEYKKLEEEIGEEYKLKLLKLRTAYVEEIKKFNVGDFVFNVLGIIKIEHVSFDYYRNNFDIIYYGYKYKKNHGVISRTKNNKLCRLREQDNLRLLK